MPSSASSTRRTDMITKGWMNMKGGRFTADMSDILHHSKDTGKDVHCPGCKAKLKLTDFKERRNDENEITTWTLKHDCGAEMTIFNEGAKLTFKQFLLHEAKKPEFIKFGSSQAKTRFDSFADSLSIEETIEALMPS